MVAINRNEVAGLDKVVAKLMSLDREDYAVPSSDAMILQGREKNEFNMFSEGREFPMTEYAKTQFNSRWPGFNTFARTLEKSNDQDLYVDTANQLLGRDDRKMVVRTMNPEGERVARAVVSDAFKPIDDHLLVPDMCEVIGDHADEWRSLGGQITDTNTFIRFITRTPVLNITTNGRIRNLHIGFQYKNSEVGRGFAEFSAFMFDSFCENGCVFGSMNIADVKYAHRGSRINTTIGRIFEERIKQQELLNIKGAIVDATRIAIQGAYVPEVKQLLERSVNCEIPDEASTDQFIKLIGKDIGLTEREQEKTLVAFDGTENMFGVQAAITQMAQGVESFERRTEIEKAAGRVMQMPDKVWNAIGSLAA